MDGEFLLLTAHRQAGKTSLAQAIVAELQEGGCCTAVIWLTTLHAEHSRGIFNRILDELKVPHSDDDNPQRYKFPKLDIVTTQLFSLSHCDTCP